MQDMAREILDQEVSCDVESYFDRLISEAFKAPQPEADRRDVARVFAIVDAVLGDRGGDKAGDDAAFDSLDTVLGTRLEMRASKLATSVRDFVLRMVDDSDAHVEGAKHIAEWFQNELRKMERTAVTTVGHLREQVLALKDTVLSETTVHHVAANRQEEKWLRDVQLRLGDYARLRLEQVILGSVARGFRLIEAQVAATLDRLQRFWKDLNELAAKFNVPPSLCDVPGSGGTPEIVQNHWRSLQTNLMARRAQLVAALDRAMEEKLAAGPGKLQRFLTQDSDIQNQLATPLRESARQLILKTMQDLNMSWLAADTRNPASLDSGELRRCIEAAKPGYPDDSAASRLLLMVPGSLGEDCLRSSLSGENGPPTTIVRVAEGDFVACQEIEQLQVRRIAAQLVSNRREYIELAGRLHTRTDFEWDDMSGGSLRRK
jgi:hypothetical protein